MNYETLFRTLENNVGLSDALLPFLLIFVVIFASLQKLSLFGTDNKRFNVIIALVLSLMTVIPHVTGKGPDVIGLLQNVLPQVSIVIVAVILALLLIGVVGGQGTVASEFIGWAAFVSFGIIIYIFGAEAGWWTNLPKKFNWWGSETQSIAIMILVMAMVIWFVCREPGKGEKANLLSDAFKNVGKVFK